MPALSLFFGSPSLRCWTLVLAWVCLAGVGLGVSGWPGAAAAAAAAGSAASSAGVANASTGDPTGAKGASVRLADGYFRQLRRPRTDRVDVESASDGPVILIVVDALRPDHMGAYGYQRDTTPYLDALADDGLLFVNSFANANWTRPTTASMLTGLLPAVHGTQAERDRLPAVMPTLPEWLQRQAKIPTAAVVGNGNAGSAFGLQRGFDTYVDTVRHWDGLPDARQVLEAAKPFVETHADGRFFLMLFLIDPHDPYGAQEPYGSMFVQHPDVPLIRTPHWELGRYSRQQVARMKAAYDGAIRYTDAELGKFFAWLRHLGIYDKATIMLTGDHGEAFGEHGVFLHSHHLYDELIRVPMILKAPKMSRRGGYTQRTFQTTDVFATVADAFGVAPPVGLQGASVLQRVSQKDGVVAPPVVISAFHNFGIQRVAVRTPLRKLIVAPPANEREFRATVGRPSLLPSVSFDKPTHLAFDLAQDPYERHNIYTVGLMQEPAWASLWQILQDYLHGRMGSAGVSAAPAQAVQLDSETYRDLKALGYIQ